MKNLLKFAVIVIIAIVSSIITFDRMPQVIVIIAFATTGIYCICRKTQKNIRKILLSLFLVTFFLQIAISMSLYAKTVDTKYYGFSCKGDDYVYGDFGTNAAKLWREGKFKSLKELEYYNLIGEASNLQEFQLYNSVIFYLFGACGGQILLIINCFLHAAIVIPVYFICRGFGISRKIITVCLVLFLFWPSTFYWSLFNFKEPMILFLIFTILAILVKLKDRFSLLNVIALFVLITGLYFLRRYIAVLFPISMLYLFCLWKWRYKTHLLCLSSISLCIKQFFGNPLFSGLHLILQRMPQTLFGIRYSSRYSATGYFNKLLTFSCARTILYFPLGVLAALFLPFLLRPETTSQIIANVESIVWWCILPFLINGIWIAIKEDFVKALPMLALLLLWISTLALSQGNMGTLLRQKSIVYCTSFIFVSIAFDRITKTIYPATENASS